MQINSHVGSPYLSALGCCWLFFWILLSLLLHALNISPMPFILFAAATTLVGFACTKTTTCVGIFLFIMPFFTLMFLLAEFFGPDYIANLEGIDRCVLLLLTTILLFQNGLVLAFADWLILATFVIAAIRLPLDGLLLSLVSDFGFIIAYFAGRGISLTNVQQKNWARVAVWTIALISVAGMLEVFGFGEGPRTILYLRVAEATTVNGVALNASYHAAGFTGLRESATMLGPLQFAPLCMAALVFWWVYYRKPLPGLMILAGLVCSVTRSAWAGTAVSIVVLGVAMGHKKHLLTYGALAVALFVMTLPFTGIGDYLTANKQGTDLSADQHRSSVQEGTFFVMQHPLGSGARNVGRQALKTNEDATYFENAYLSLAGAYGIPVVLCLLGFIVEILRLSIRARTQLGFAVLGVLVGFGIVLMFASLHDVFPLACWIWFPAGLLVTQATQSVGPSSRPISELSH
jgi:O-Antigen ligase